MGLLAVVIHQVEGGDLSVLEDSDTGCGSMAKEELVKLRVHDIPWAIDVVVEESVKVGVQLLLCLFWVNLNTALGYTRGVKRWEPGGYGGDIPCG